MVLTHFKPIIHFYIPQIIRKLWFSDVLRGIEMQGVNQNITIGTAWPQLGKQTLARPNVAGESVGWQGGGRSETPFPPAGFLWDQTL